MGLCIFAYLRISYYYNDTAVFNQRVEFLISTTLFMSTILRVMSIKNTVYGSPAWTYCVDHLA